MAQIEVPDPLAAQLREEVARAINDSGLRLCLREILGPSLPLPPTHRLYDPAAVQEPNWRPHPPRLIWEPRNWRPIPPEHYQAIKHCLMIVFRSFGGGMYDNVDPEMFEELHRKLIQQVYYRMLVQDYILEPYPWTTEGRRWIRNKQCWKDLGSKWLIQAMLLQDWYEAKAKDWMWSWKWVTKPLPCT